MQGLLISFVATAVGQPMSLVASDLEHFAAMYQAESVARMPTTSVGPVLAQQWSANITLRATQDGSGSQQESSVQQFYFDGKNQRYRNVIEGTSDLFHPGQKINIDQTATNTTGLNFNMTLGTGDDAVCKPTQRPYTDPFAIIALASTRNGSSIVGGQPCDVWDGVVGNLSVFACIGSDGVPREVSFQPAPGQPTITQTWSDIKVGPPPEEVFAPSKACATNYPTTACDKTGTTTLDVYRIHSLAEAFSLENRNIGDALGDMAFTCLSNGSGFGGASVVSWWKVEVSVAFGQYAYCLYDPVGHTNYCNGGTGRQVGRESASGQGVGHLQGQCSANLDAGSWYSLPAGGQCADGQSMGTDGCTWRNAQRVRTVNVSCIMNERGLAHSCKEEYGHAPFSKSAAIFEAALASGDSAQGGCPDITPPTEVIV